MVGNGTWHVLMGSLIIPVSVFIISDRNRTYYVSRPTSLYPLCPLHPNTLYLSLHSLCTFQPSQYQPGNVRGNAIPRLMHERCKRCPFAKRRHLNSRDHLGSDYFGKSAPRTRLSAATGFFTRFSTRLHRDPVRKVNVIGAKFVGFFNPPSRNVYDDLCITASYCLWRWHFLGYVLSWAMKGDHVAL